MATIAPPVLVPGVARIPLPFGLFSVLAFRGDAARWENGVQWETLTCEPVGGVGAPDCDPETDTIGIPKDLGANGSPIENATPFTVYGHHTCSPIGHADAFGYAREQAEAHLLAREEARVEQALWTGDLGNEPDFAGLPSIGSVAAAAAWDAVGLLEQHIATTYGSQGILHMSRLVATRLFDDGKLEKRGGRLFTPLDTPVVAGAGYGSEKIVGTAPLLGYRSEVFPAMRPVLDTSNNNLTAIAERTYLLGFDECGGASVALTVAP